MLGHVDEFYGVYFEGRLRTEEFKSHAEATRHLQHLLSTRENTGAAA